MRPLILACVSMTSIGLSSVWLSACFSNTTSTVGDGSGSTAGSASSGSSHSGASTGGSGSASTGSPASSGRGGSGSTGGNAGAGSTGSAAATGSTGAAGTSGGGSTKLAGPPAGPYHVTGPQILDKNGHPHLFRGLDRPSLEWSCTGDIATDEYSTMQSWGANVVRLPLNQDCWLSDASNPTYNSTYASTVDQQVQLAKAAGLDIILDLHWSDQGSYTVGAACMLPNGNCQQDMADAHSVIFWQQLATKYANDPSILFELYNEPKIGSYMPQSADWTTWLNGGTSSGFTVHGMQELYTTVRGTGANNLVIIGGLNWAYDLTGVPTHTVVGTNIIYNTHPYQDKTNPNPAGWTQFFGSLTATYPVIATEFGDHGTGQPTPACSPTFDQGLIPYMDAAASGSNPTNKISWTAWAFYYSTSCTFPPLLADTNFNPNAPGMVVQAALQNGP